MNVTGAKSNNYNLPINFLINHSIKKMLEDSKKKKKIHQIVQEQKVKY